jgi:hypothetical protein
MSERLWDLNDLCTLKGAADALGESNTTVHNWSARYQMFPKPLIEVGRSPMYSWKQLKDWYMKKWPAKAQRKGLFNAVEEDKGRRPHNETRWQREEHEAVRGSAQEGNVQKEGSAHQQFQAQVKVDRNGIPRMEIVLSGDLANLPPGQYIAKLKDGDL